MTRMTGLITTGATADTPTIEIFGARGDVENPQVAQDGDSTGALKFVVSDGGGDSSKTLAQFRSTIFANSTDDAPQSLLDLLIGAGGTSYSTFRFAGDGTMAIQGAMKVGVFANDGARDAGVIVPTVGMIIFNQRDDSSGVPKFQGYDGGNWVDLH